MATKLHNPLPYVLAFITGKHRYKPEFEWSDSLMYNIFRVYESIFWRKIGIKKEASYINGKMEYFTLEARLTAFEGWLKSLFDFSFISGLSLERGAIALDTNTSNTAASFSYTVTGANPYMAVVTEFNYSSQTLSALSYNSVGLTSRVTDDNSSTFANSRSQLWNLANPSTGSQTFARTGTLNSLCVASYSGATSSGVPDASAHTYVASASSATVTVNVIASGCWAIGGNRWGGGTAVSNNSGVTTTDRDASAHRYWDSNGTVATGNNTVSFSAASADEWTIVAMSFTIASAVVSTASTSGRDFMLTNSS